MPDNFHNGIASTVLQESELICIIANRTKTVSKAEIESSNPSFSRHILNQISPKEYIFKPIRSEWRSISRVDFHHPRGEARSRSTDIPDTENKDFWMAEGLDELRKVGRGAGHEEWDI